MPRLPPSLLRQARVIDPFLPPLLAPCRDLNAAQNELRWLREHADKVAKRDGPKRRLVLKKLVRKRAAGTPLQYLLGTEYFGELEIRCRPGVLIPRQDTAASVTHLAHLLRRAKDLPQELRVLDLCTGTGCIPLLFQHEFCTTRSDTQLRILGVDIAQKAINLAQHNARRTLDKQSTKVDFVRADVLIEPWGDQTLDPPCMKAALNFNRLPYFWDILVSNPPYISPSAFWKTTTRSVRGFEPKLALVPPPSKSGTDEQQGDAFYPRLLTIAQDVEAKIVLLEVADLEQASRVARMAREMNIFDGIEIWKDQPDQDSSTNDQEDTSDPIPPIIGTGNGRSVLCWRGKGAAWLERSIESTSPVSSQKSSECDEASQHSLLPVFDFYR